MPIGGVAFVVTSEGLLLSETLCEGGTNKESSSTHNNEMCACRQKMRITWETKKTKKKTTSNIFYSDFTCAEDQYSSELSTYRVSVLHEHKCIEKVGLRNTREHASKSRTAEKTFVLYVCLRFAMRAHGTEPRHTHQFVPVYSMISSQFQ